MESIKDMISERIIIKTNPSALHQDIGKSAMRASQKVARHQTFRLTDENL